MTSERGLAWGSAAPSRLRRLTASTIVLSALLPGAALHQLHAQTDPPIFSWQGEVQVSTSTLTIREGESVTYNLRLSEQPAADGWWVFVQVDGVVYTDGLLDDKGLRWVPSVGWETNRGSSSGPTPWRNVQIHAVQDDDMEDEFVTFTHEVGTRTPTAQPSSTLWPPLRCESLTTTVLTSRCLSCGSRTRR